MEESCSATSGSMSRIGNSVITCLLYTSDAADEEDSKEDIRIFLRYHNESPAITTIEKISKPGKRVYVASDDIPRVLNGLGISVISSSKGVISNKVARELKVGGELLCNVW